MKGNKIKARKIVALMGSPRKGGNTDTLVTEILKAAEKQGAVTDKIYLIDHNIRPCLMCFKDPCRHNDEPCFLIDDFNAILDRIKSADTLIMASPVYWGNVSGMMKMFMERGYALFDREWKNSKIAGKNGVIVVCYGDGDAERQAGPVFFSIDMFLRFCEIEVVDRIVAMADAKGEVAENVEAMRKAAEIGKKLALLP